MVDNKNYVCTLTTSLNEIEEKYLNLSNEYKQYKINQENVTSLLTSKLTASEEIVKQLIPGKKYFTIHFKIIKSNRYIHV